MNLRMFSMVACGCALVLGSAEPALADNRVPNVTVREGQRFATIWIYPDCPHTISYRTEDGTAKAPDESPAGLVVQVGALVDELRGEEGRRPARADYHAVSGHLVMDHRASGGQAFRIPIVNDAVRERTETARVIVDITSNEVWFGVGAAGCSPGTPTFQRIEATLTIVDDD